MNVLFVCTGNTCAGVMAEYLLRSMAEKRGLDLRTASCGLMVTPGQHPGSDCIRAIAAFGLDISQHEAQPITPALMAWADTVICIFEKHRCRLVDLFPDQWPKITILPFALTDPYGQGYNCHRETADELRVQLLQWLRLNHLV